MLEELIVNFAIAIAVGAGIFTVVAFVAVLRHFKDM